MKTNRTAPAVIGFLLSLFFLTGAVLAAGGDNDLRRKAEGMLGQLPQAMTSDRNPITPEKVRLGRMLYYEPRISVDGTVSCSKCHPVALYGADGLRKAIGHNCALNPRNAPTIFNAADQISEHWIGNRTTVEDQAKQAITGPPAFGMPSYEAAEKVLRGFREYRELFRVAFPGSKEPVTIDNFALAVGAYERTLVTPAPFDAFLKGEDNAITGEQKKGLQIFMELGCASCHSGPFAGGRMYRKFGIVEPYWKYTKSENPDPGRYAVTKNDADRYVFKVPVLRNVAKTAPYFHDGSVESLEEAVRIMGKVQLGRELQEEQIDRIAGFLRSLTGEISPDALTVPLLPSAN